MDALLEAGQVVAEIEPGKHLANHDMRFWLYQCQVFERARIEGKLVWVFESDR